MGNQGRGRNTSPAIERILRTVRETFCHDPAVADIFEACYTNTLDTTVKRKSDGTTYVITGDIPAMWLRDSTAQLRPYLIPAREDPDICEMIVGLVKRQFAYIHIDPYANAFNEEANGRCWAHDETEMDPWVWERKYEIDSLCYPVQLAYLLWKHTGVTGHFDDSFIRGIRHILDVFETEMDHENLSRYTFSRRDCVYTDTLSRDGRGAHVKPNTGLIWSGFRPSDDACVYGYLIPSNMFASVILEYIHEIMQFMSAEYSVMEGDGSDGGQAEDIRQLGERALTMSRIVRDAVERFGVTKVEDLGSVYAYEVDGYGQYHMMDDANVPSLLSMSYIGYRPDDAGTAANTRAYILSERNPYYYRGKCASGIGSPHTPVMYIWHISMAMEGLTSESREEKYAVIRKMIETDGKTGLMHEGFHVDDPTCFTREWFSWANALFCELVLQCCGYTIA